MAQGYVNTDRIDSLLKSVNDPEKKIDLMLEQSTQLKGQSPEVALNYSNLAYSNAISINYLRGEINALISIASVYLYLGDFDKSKENIEKAILKSEQFSMKSETARAESILALIFQELGDYEKNSFYDFKSLSYYEQIQDSSGIEITLGNIGIDFINQKDYKRALEYLNKSLRMAIKINDIEGIAYQYNNIANVYLAYQKDYDSALRNFQEAYKINLTLKNKKQEGIYLMNIGNAFLNLNRNDSALDYYKKARSIFREINNELYVTNCQIALGEYYYKIHEMNLSLKYADSSFNTTLKNNFKPGILYSASLLNQIYLNRNDSSKAYKYLVIKHQIMDSIADAMNKKELYKIEHQYNYDKAEKLKLIQDQKRNFWIIITIVSLVLMVIITILLYSRQRIKNKNNALEKEKIVQELNFKDKELALNIMSLIKKNEMFSDILNKLTTVEGQIKHVETKDIVSRIVKDLRHNNDNKMLTEFTLRFQEVHAGFYEKLLNSYPDLTQNELKLCAFLRLNMSSKEISEITSQQPLTIDKGRTRLRKKLCISNTETNLVTFLTQI
jgi:tetratricopeptide (TPR) repeat protein